MIDTTTLRNLSRRAPKIVAEKKRQAYEQAQPGIDEANLLARIDRLYGIAPEANLNNRGVTTNQGFIDEASANKAALDAILGGQRSAALAEGTSTLNERFGRAFRQNRQQIGAQGLAGGSADRSARRQMLANLFKGRANLALGADTAGRTARNSIDQRRMELQRQVKLGTAPNLDTLNSVGEQRGAIDEAYRGLGQQALGDLFANTGNVYYAGQEAAGMGRAGPSAFSANLTRKRPSTTGTYLN